MRIRPFITAGTAGLFVSIVVVSVSGQGNGHKKDDDVREGRRLFESETFGGNGRTCVTCHSSRTGTVSPQDAQARFNRDSHDPLFLLDGSDDGLGSGVSRMLADATILMKIPLPPNVRLGDSADRFVVVPRGIPTTLNTPAFDPVLMLDGRQDSLELQAGGAIHDHAEATVEPSLKQLELIKQFQRTDAFFSSPALRQHASGGPNPELPRGNTDAERRGRVFFEDVPPNPADFRPGLCAACHSGTLMNQTNEFASQFIGFPVRTGTRFQNVLVSEFNDPGRPVREFIFNEGTPRERHVFSTDPGRALITGQVDGDPLAGDTTFEHTNAFKIPQLRGIRNTAPYFHDNSSKTLEDVALHYGRFFITVTRGQIRLTPQDMSDIVAFLKLLD